MKITILRSGYASRIPAVEVRVGDVLDLSDEDEGVWSLRVSSVVVDEQGRTTVNGDRRLPLYVWKEAWQVPEPGG